MNWNPQLDLAEQYLCRTNVSVFLTGKAGTGKTTFLKHITQSIHKRFVVVAPTGVAAINAGGVTIHSLFQLPFCPYLPDVKELITEYQMPEARRKMRKNKIDLLRTLDLLIIDEISMVRADLLDAIDYSLKRYRRNHQPFGGVQLLMIGDLRQLPPVVTDEEKPFMDRVYPSPFFFNSKALQHTDYITIELATIYRQQDPTFVNLLNNIRNNQFDDATLDALNRRYLPDFDDKGKDYIRLTTHNHQADSINRRHMDELTSRAVTINATVEGLFPETSMPVPQQLELKEGEQVMFIKNDSTGAHRYYNGKIGVITSIKHGEDDYTIVVRDSEGNSINASRETWENLHYEIDPADKQIKQKTDGTFTQYPLRPAWAITIHKAQGLTFDHVIIDAAAAFTFGQVYVALSRCRTYEGLVLSSPITRSGAITSSDIVAFDQSRPNEESVRQALDSYASRYLYESLFELFDVSGLVHLVERISRLFEEHLRTTYPHEIEELHTIANQLLQLNEVSDRFRRQISRLAESNAAGSPAINERIAKGAQYYHEQLMDCVRQLKPIVGVDIDNKETRADMAENVRRLEESMGIKVNAFSVFQKEPFSVDRYNKVKVDRLLENRQDNGHESKRDKESSRSSRTTATSFGHIANTQLAIALSQWRKATADEQEVPAYVVMQQKTLLAIADQEPHTLHELSGITGMGKKRIEQYGEEILRIVRENSK